MATPTSALCFEPNSTLKTSMMTSHTSNAGIYSWNPKVNQYAKRIPTSLKKYFWDVLEFHSEAPWVTGAWSGDRGHFTSPSCGRGLSTSQDVNHFPKSHFLPLMLSISIRHFSTTRKDPPEAAAMFRLYGDNTLWRSQWARSRLLFTGGTRESQKRWSTAIRQLDSPSPALDRPCPPFLDKAELHWWRPHESRLCLLQRPRSPASHSASGSPERNKPRNKAWQGNKGKGQKGCVYFGLFGLIWIPVTVKLF